MTQLNLIPQSMKKKKLNSNGKLIFFSTIILLSCLFFAFFLPYYFWDQATTKESELKTKVDAQSSVIEERTQKETNITNMNQFIATVDAFGLIKPLISEYIVELQELIPSDIVCTSINYTAFTITMSGVAEKYESPSEFVANLQESSTFSNASLQSIAESEAGYVFSVTIMLLK